MKKKIGFIGVSLLLALMACTTTVKTSGSYIRLSPVTAETRPVEATEVEVFFKKQPDYPYREIGIVEGVAKGSRAGLQNLFPELQEQAAAMGATAIYKIEIQRYHQAGDALHATAVAIIPETASVPEN